MFHGADPTGAQALGHRLLRLSGVVRDTTDRLVLAEALAEYPTGSVGALDDVSQQLRSTAAAVEAAAHQVGSFRLPLSLQWRPLRRRSPRLPTAEADAAERDLFAQLMRAIDNREAPTDAGLPVSYFPPGYEDWLDADRAVTAAAERLADYRRIAGGRPGVFDGSTEYALAQRLHELVASRSDLLFQQAIDASSVGGNEPFVSTSAIGVALAGSFRSGRQLLGQHFADHPPSVDGIAFYELLATDSDIASGFFNRLGPQGVVTLMHRLAAEAPEHDGDPLRQVAVALGTVERAARLGFSGAELVDADVALFRSPRPFANDLFHIEQALLRGEFSSTFVIEAARASFERHDVGSHPGAEVSAALTDRRITAMATLLAHDATAAFIADLDDQALGELIAPPAVAAYGVEHPDLGGDDTLTTLFFSSLVADHDAPERLIDTVAALDTDIPDPRVADGVSLVMAHEAIDYHSPEREPVFLQAFDRVVSSGSGLAVVAASLGDMTSDFVRDETAKEWITRRSPSVEAFGGFVSKIRARYLQGEFDRDARLLNDIAESDRLLLIASGVSTGLSAVSAVGGAIAPLALGGAVLGAGGFAAIGATALALSAVLLAIGLFNRDDDDPRLVTVTTHAIESKLVDDQIQRAVVAGLDVHPLQTRSQLEAVEDWSILLADAINDAADHDLSEVLGSAVRAVDGG